MPVVTRDVRAAPGRGITGNADGQPIAAGNSALMSELGWQLAPSLIEPARSLEASGHTVIYLGWEGRVRALLALDDTPLAEARSMIEELQSLGPHVALVSGDLAPAARRAGAAVGIEDVQAGLSPEAKRAALDRYRQRYGVVAMVGDGLNDGPVLADADVGIAVGSATDLARETASLVLPVGGLWMLPWVIAVARSVRNHPHQPHMGIRLQPCRALACRARTPAAGAGGCGHGEFEPSPGGQFTATVPAARSRSAGAPRAAVEHGAEQCPPRSRRFGDGWSRDRAGLNG
jgi:soluble P-type ATPase